MSELLAAQKGWLCQRCEYSLVQETCPFACPRCMTPNSLVEADVVTLGGEVSKAKKEPKAQLATTQPQAQAQVIQFPAAKIKPQIVIKKEDLKSKPKILGEVTFEPFKPYSSHVRSFDRVVGGLASCFSIIIAGTKGAGKSTLVTQLLMLHCLKDPSAFVVYGSPEEPEKRLLERIFRLGFDKPEHIEILKTRVIASREDEICAFHDQVRKYKNFPCRDGVTRSPTLVIYDSIRRYKHKDVKTPSFLSHGPEVIGEIVDISEELKLCNLIIARLTKDSKLAGSEDMGYDVDCIVQLDKTKKKRIVQLSCDKNRMGREDRLGLFRMTDRGLISISKPKKKK